MLRSVAVAAVEAPDDERSDQDQAPSSFTPKKRYITPHTRIDELTILLTSAVQSYDIETDMTILC